MYSLVKTLWAMYFEKPTLKVLIIGINESGKSNFELDLKMRPQFNCLLTRLKMNANQKAIEFQKIIPTVGLNKKYNALIWDLGGAPLLRAIWKKYYPDCHGIVFVIDQDYEAKKEELIKTFGKQTKILKRVFKIVINSQYKQETIISSPDNKGVPILILINKIENQQDQGRPIVDEISTALSISLVHDRKIIVKTCSAITGQNVDSSMQELFEQILRISNSQK